MSQRNESEPTPRPVRWAGRLVAFEGAAAVLVASILVIRAATGHDQRVVSGYGTAAWFVVLGGAVLAGGIALLTGRRWGRAVAIVAQVLLLPVAWSLLTDSHQPAWGVLLGVIVVATLALLFSRAANQWMAAQYSD